MPGLSEDIKECYRSEIHEHLAAGRSLLYQAEQLANRKYPPKDGMAEYQTMGILSLAHTTLAFVLMMVSDSEEF